MITKFDEFENENESLRIEHELIKSLFSIAFKKIIAHIKKIHGTIKEDHVLEFINQYMLNEYGVNMNHSKESLNYVRHLIHKRFKNKDL